MVRLCANVKTGTLSCERHDVFSSKNTIPGSILSTPLSLFIAGFLSSIANASRTFRSFIPVALSITRTLCQSMSCDPFLWRTCSAMADFSGWLSRIASRCSFVRTSRAFIVFPTHSSWQVSHFNTQHPFVFHSAVCPLHCTSHWGSGVGRTSIRFQLPGQFVWLHSSLPQWMEWELPAILPCWSLHLPRTAGAPKLSSNGVSMLSHWTFSDSHFLAFHPWCARFPPSLIFRHCKPSLLCQQTLEQFHVWPALSGGYQRRGIDPCVGFLCTAVHLRSPPLLNSTSMNGIFLSFSRSIVNVIRGCCSFRWSNNHASSELRITEMTLSTNRCQIFGGAWSSSQAFFSNSSMKMSATTGDTGDPIATPSCCL